jgi:hypothetical protein
MLAQVQQQLVRFISCGGEHQNHTKYHQVCHGPLCDGAMHGGCEAQNWTVPGLQPLVIVLHSTTCTISMTAHNMRLLVTGTIL